MPAVAVASTSRPLEGPVVEASDRLDRVGPPAVLGGIVALYVAVFGHLTWRQHANWRSLGFDTGIYDQGMWLLSQGRDPFMTMRGMDYWGHHVAPIGYLFAPIYWLGGGVQAVSLVHTAWVAAGAIPLWLLARDRFQLRWEALVVPAAYLLHPALHWVTWWLFHPDSLAITPLLFAWWLARAERWRWFAVAGAVAMLCKEDVALAVLVLGVVIAVRGNRRAGGLTALAGLAWFAFCSKVVIPLRNDHAPPFYESYFPSLGGSLGEILRNLVFHPSRAWRLLTRPRVPDYALKMLGPVGFVTPFLGPLGLLVAGPQLGVNLLVEVQDGATIKSQYASMPIVGIFLGVAEGMALLRRRPALLRAAALWLLACALVGSRIWGLAPYSHDFRSGVWADRPRPNVAQLERARATVPPGASVSATWNIVSHFTHRPIVYEYPNPWLSSNYGPTGNEVGDPTTVEWLVIERSALGAKDVAMLERLLGPGGGYRTVQDEEGVTVAHRVGTGSLVPP
jgi:uncharacterized membrane protein